MNNWQQLKDCTSARTKELKDQADAVVDRMESNENRWVKQLREKGFKAAHPNDGWIDRANNTFQLTYPQFDDGVEEGDKVMLGWAWERKENVPVLVTKVERPKYGSVRYHYEKIEKPKPPKKSLLERLFPRLRSKKYKEN